MSSPSEVERRGEPRIAAAHPIVLEWESGEGEFHRARGTTRDMALGGVYCFLERPLERGTAVNFSLVLPAELTRGNPLKLRCKGRVLRSERSGQRAFGVAVSVDSSEVAETLSQTDDAGRQRIYARVVPSATLQAEYPGMRSVVRDISLAGAFIEDDRPLPIGRIFKLRLSSDRLPTEIELAAVVRRSEPHVGMAVEFVALDRQAKETLGEIVQHGRPWRGMEEVFPTAAWRAAESGEAAPKLAELTEFIRQRAADALPQLEVVACHYRVGDCQFSLHLREPHSQAELLLPISERWVAACREGEDCTEMDRVFGSASRILDLPPPPGLRKA